MAPYRKRTIPYTGVSRTIPSTHTIPHTVVFPYSHIYTYVCQIFVLLPTFLFVRALFGKTVNSDTWSPAGHIGRGLGAIRALWSAWQALKVFFPAGVDKTISLVSAREALFCTYVSVNVVCFLTYCSSTDCTFLCVGARSTDHLPDSNSSSAQSVLTSSFLQYRNPAA